MTSDFISIVLGFIEGFALIISPCILPILPIFLAGSLTGSKKRPLGILVGFILFFVVLVFFSRQLVSYLGINFDVLRYVSYAILLLLGVVLCSSYLTEQFSQITQGVTRIGSFFAPLNNPEGGFFNGMLFGGLVAIIWTPCAGPILAAIIVQTVTQKATLISFFTLAAFAFGAGIPMLIIAFYGKKLIDAFALSPSRMQICREFLGAVLIASVVNMIYFEGRDVPTQSTAVGIKTSSSLINDLWRPYPAPKVEGISGWINSEPLHLSDLKGKVVLIDFWTYSCINCLRTLPYVNNWYKQYHDKGLVIIGVHTPEFAFEKNMKNVSAAVTRNGILYPVALDNQFVTWLNFNNHYWPAHYLINQDGKVVYQHFGEGDYDITENNIRFLLGINTLKELKTAKNEPFIFSQTPETYLGYERAEERFSPKLIQDKESRYSFAAHLPSNAWSLEGLWKVSADNISSAEANAVFKMHFNARKVFLVMGNSSATPIKVKVLLNGEPLTDKKGKDVEESSILVDKYSIYEVVSQQQAQGGYLELIASEPGVKMYTVTFGS